MTSYDSLISSAYKHSLMSSVRLNPSAVDSGIKKVSLPGGEEFPLTEDRGLEEEEGEGENPLDSSIEEPELVEAFAKGVGEPVDGR